MFTFRASLADRDATRNLDAILSRNFNPAGFKPDLRRLQRLSATASSFYPPPWPAPGLAVTPEINCQSELWLPLAEIRPVFERFFRQSLNYPPILTSTPFAAAASWAAIVALLPFGPDCSMPDRLLARLLTDVRFRLQFLCWAFMPRRFYGAGSRYPEQIAWLAAWLEKRRKGQAKLRCLDAACGVGFAAYDLARLLVEQGRQWEDFIVEGWTLDPLEAWSAAHALLPHDTRMTGLFRRQLSSLAGGLTSLTFRAVDLLAAAAEPVEKFDLILCNGLLGGPIVNSQADLELAASRLASLLAPGGVLLVADHFHGGWKKKCPPENQRALLQSFGFNVTIQGAEQEVLIVAERKPGYTTSGI